MIIVLTGGIGSGKTSASEILARKYGFDVYEADKRVKDLYESHPELLARIEEALNMSCRTEDGRFDPSLLASRIFADENDLNKVESLVFPVLMEDFQEWKNSCEAEDFVFESATVLEKAYFKKFWDAVIIVDAPVSVRLQRASKRDDTSEEQIRARMSHQKLMNAISEGGLVPEGCYKCMNEGTLDELESNLDTILQELRLKQKCYTDKQKS